MRDRRRALLLASAMWLIATGCSQPRHSAENPQTASTERAVRLPGEYVAPEELDRGAPSSAVKPAVPSSQDILAGLPMGRVLFACPSTMRVQASDRVEVRISGDPKADLVSGLQGRGIPVEQAAQIAPVMKVLLTAEEASVFDVKALSEDEQLVSGAGFSQWVWSVTPLQSGTHNLYLTVNVVVNVPGYGAQKKQIPVLSQAVQVRSDVGYSASHFWSSNWQWFMSTLLIPLALWLWRKRSTKA